MIGQPLWKKQKKYAEANKIDPSQITVVAVYPNQNKDSTPVYHAYLYKSNMTAYGYMTKESNTCINKSFNYVKDGWGQIRGVKYEGGYDLLLAKLTQVSKDQITGEQYKSYSYTADLFTRKKDSGSSNALTQKSLEYTHKVRVRIRLRARVPVISATIMLPMSRALHGMIAAPRAASPTVQDRIPSSALKSSSIRSPVVLPMFPASRALLPPTMPPLRMPK